jgi:hypothetical protein
MEILLTACQYLTTPVMGFIVRISEHLSLKDFRQSLINSYKVLKMGGIFRCVVPDLESAARSYLNSLDNGDNLSSLNFMNNTLLGVKERPRGLKEFFVSFFWKLTPPLDVGQQISF